MVTGQPPFPGTEIDARLDAHLHQDLTPPDHLNISLSSGLGEVVEYMMAKNRKQRYRSADDLILDLECLLTGQPPKLAGIESPRARLPSLPGSRDEEDEEEFRRLRADGGNHWVWLAVLAGLLAMKPGVQPTVAGPARLTTE